MKYLIVFALLTMVALKSPAQTSLSWVDHFELAQKQSLDTNKPILVFFSGSDWCKPCIKLKKQVLETPEFKEYSAKFILYNADFPYRVKQEKALKAENEKLAEKYNKQGQFPKVAILSSQGKELCSVGAFDGTPSEFIAKLDAMLKNAEKP
jgi:thioredoxin-related protein